MRNAGRRPQPTASPRQPSQAVARSIEDELLSASANTPAGPSSSSRHSGRSSTALVHTALDEDSSRRPSAAPTSARGTRTTVGPLARADSRSAETARTATAAVETKVGDHDGHGDGGGGTAWAIDFGPGSKRRRKPSPQAAHVRARLEGGRTGGDAPASSTASGANEPPLVASRPALQSSGMPTPSAPPPRRRAVLLETPLFIREEREAAAAAGNGPHSTSTVLPDASPAPLTASLFARGLSRLRSSASEVLATRESTVRGSQSRARKDSRRGPKAGSVGSPWDLSTIPSSSARRASRHPHAEKRSSHGGSDRSSSVSSFSRTEMLQFLQPSPTRGAVPHAQGPAAAAGASASAGAPSGGGVHGASAQPISSGDPRYAVLSSISSSLADIVSSSRSSLRSSLAAAPPPRVDGTTLQPDSRSSGGSAGGGRRGLARSPTVMDPPNVSSIHGEEEEIRRRQQDRLARYRHGDRAAPQAPPVQLHHTADRRGDVHTIQLPGIHARQDGLRPRGSAGLAAETEEFDPRSSRPHRERDTAAGAGAAMSQGPSSTNTFSTHGRSLRSRLATVCRWCGTAVTVLVVVLCWLCVASPLLVDLDEPQDTLTRYYVNPVSELHALYRVAPASVPQPAVRQLYGRALSEGVERLERSTAHLAELVASATRADKVLYLQQLVRAYVAVQHRARLYARGRDESAVRRFVVYPVTDAWHFGLGRHGLRYTFRRLVRKPSLRYATELVRGTVNCLAQNEELPCPTLLFVEQSMMILSAPEPELADDEESQVRDVNAGLRVGRSQWSTLRRDWESEVYLETLLTFIRESIRQTTRDYNHSPDV